MHDMKLQMHKKAVYTIRTHVVASDNAPISELGRHLHVHKALQYIWDRAELKGAFYTILSWILMLVIFSLHE